MLVYKYYSSNLIQVLESSMVRFTPPKYLNDSAFDCKPIVKSVFTLAGIQEIIDDVFGENMSGIVRTSAIDFVSKTSTVELVVVFRKILLSMMDNPEKINSVGIALLDNSIREEILSLETDAISDKLLDHFVFLLKSNPQLPSLLREGLGAGMVNLEKEIRPQFESALHESIDSKIGVFCLSSSPSCPVMWGQYANSGKGYVIGFKSESPFFDQRTRSDDILKHLYQVVYTEDRSTIEIGDYFLSDKSTEHRMRDFVKDVLLKKGKRWEYENEWRMFQELLKANCTVDANSQKIHLFKFPPEAVGEIIVGYNTSNEDQERIQSAAEKTYQNAKLKRAVISRDEYRIDSISF